jgi:DNA-binding CsgD family transcriptional regulator
MHKTVAGGEPITTRLDRAWESHRRARRDDALEQLVGCEEWPHPYNEQGLALRAEILTGRDAILALQELAAHQDLFTSTDGQFDYLIASARAYTNSRNFDFAREMLETAQALVEGENDPRISRLAFHRARLACIMREFDPNRDDFALALRDSDPQVQFATLEWRSWMHAGLEDYRAQLQDFQAAFRLFEKEGYRCNYTTVATALHAMLRLAFEVGDTAALAAGESAYEAIEWTPDIQDYRFLCARALAWDAYLRGEPARAQWLFKDSKEIAPTTAWKVMAHVDRAYVARMNENEAWATEELYQAHSLAQRVTWSATSGEERMALITMAVLFAPLDMAQAQRYVSTYIQLGSDGMKPMLAATYDRRAMAFEKYATGRVQQVLGNTKLAVRSYETAFEIFSQSEHYYRAALAANALYELTHEPAWLEVARSNAARFPQSAIYHRLHDQGAAKQEPALANLTSLQRQIAIGIGQGLEIDELSQRFSRSTFTIENQIDAIYTALGVKSRHALRSELQRKGVL